MLAGAESISIWVTSSHYICSINVFYSYPINTTPWML